jgi:hypothetical protein
MTHKVSLLRVVISGVKPDSWIIRSLENNGFIIDDDTSLVDYNAGVLVLVVYLDKFDWVCEVLSYTENRDTTYDQLLEFYHEVTSYFEELGDYPDL